MGALKIETQDNNVLAGLSDNQREKLRRILLVSTEDDWTIAQKIEVPCNSMHVQAMRRRLRMLGVLPTVVDELRPPVRRPTTCQCEPSARKVNPETRICKTCRKEYPKYVNAELFEEGVA